ncbi:MAG TPA: F0F1 ATP synthase subunit A [Verrucomicrobiae bacterium]|nr:F0F1 ATP synthase subunit A [Verrucomicrobiae bacterium]
MKAILVAVSLFFLPLLMQAAELPGAAPLKEEGMSPKATEVFRIGQFPVTNSMLVTWIVALGVIIFAQIAGRNMKRVPSGAQNFWEWMVESLYTFLESIVGADLVKKTFWFFATIFIFIFFTNWVGLIPGVGTVGWGHATPEGFVITRPWFRGGNADLNMTFAMAAIFMVLWLVWAIQSNGVGGFFLHIFGPKGDSTGVMKYLMIVIFLAVGLIEVLSISFRPISLSFRLFGNIFAGENLLEGMGRVIEHPAWLKSVAGVVLPIPFYFMELLVGLVQALVFMLLTAVFTSVMCAHDEGHEKTAHH